MRNIKVLFVTLGILLGITGLCAVLFKFDDIKPCTVVNYQNNMHLLMSEKDSKSIRNANQLLELKDNEKLYKIYVTYESTANGVNSYSFYCNSYLDFDNGTNVTQVVLGKTCLLLEII